MPRPTQQIEVACPLHRLTRKENGKHRDHDTDKVPLEIFEIVYLKASVAAALLRRRTTGADRARGAAKASLARSLP
jgi:hypothetical protein